MPHRLILHSLYKCNHSFSCHESVLQPSFSDSIMQRHKSFEMRGPTLETCRKYGIRVGLQCMDSGPSGIIAISLERVRALNEYFESICFIYLHLFSLRLVLLHIMRSNETPISSSRFRSQLKSEINLRYCQVTHR